MKNKQLKIIFGLLLIPFATALFFIDRAILIVLFWQNSPSIQEYFKQMHNIKMALYRLFAFLAIYAVIILFKWIL